MVKIQSNIDIHNMLFAVAYQYHMECIMAAAKANPRPIREAFIVSWCIANRHRLINNAAHVADKVTAAYGKPYNLNGTKCTVVEFIFDSWFMLLYNYMPSHDCTPIEPEWIAMVDKKATEHIALMV